MMFIRYIIDFFTLCFCRCKYKRKNFFTNIIPLRKYSGKVHTSVNNTSLDILINNLKRFKRIIVLGSGPSLNELKDFDNDTLYLTTNSSVCTVINYNFVYFTFTREYINTYLLNGFKSEGWQGTFFLFTKSKYRHSIRMESYKRIINYLSFSSNKKKEILISDIESNGTGLENYIKLNSFSETYFGIKYQNHNSGVSLLVLGLYMAKELGKTIEIYGIDAGFGGNIYAKENFDFPGDEISNKHAIETLTKIYKKLKYSSINFHNYTYFNLQ